MRALLVAVVALALLPVAQAGLTAGDIDDNLNWGPYQVYRARALAADPAIPAHDLSDRLTVDVVDAAGDPVPLAHVTASADNGSVGLEAGADGVIRLFPHQDGLSGPVVHLAASDGATKDIPLGQLPADRTVRLVTTLVPHAPAALDVLFVVDTTGSMGDELSYLTSEFGVISARIVAEHPQLPTRFGLIVYKDVVDEFVVKDLGFTTDVATFQGWLNEQTAAGGGDYPEAMDQAMHAAAQVPWRTDAVKMLFLVADAPPHAADAPNYLTAVDALRREGARIHPLAGSGADDQAQSLMREAAVLTQGRYAFLTDDSGIGDSHALPTVPCYVVTELKDLMVRMVDSQVTGQRVEAAPSTIIREVGNYGKGVCYTLHANVQQTPTGPTTSPVTLPPVETPVVLPPIVTDPSASSSPSVVVASPAPTASPRATVSPAPTESPTVEPTPTDTPAGSPTDTPHGDPTSSPTVFPSVTLPPVTLPPMTMTMAPDPVPVSGTGLASGGAADVIAAGTKGARVSALASGGDSGAFGSRDGSVDALTFSEPPAAAPYSDGSVVASGGLASHDGADPYGNVTDPWMGTLAHPDMVAGSLPAWGAPVGG
ncbi:MAG: vWA domain-containing protein, partial [Thermoplasmatota archaeon]